MKGILIIAQPRTGGTNIMRGIGEYYNKTTVFEPNLLAEAVMYSPTEDVVKAIPYWEADMNDLRHFDYNLLLKRIQEFETVLLLSRKNKEDQADSYYALKYISNFDKDAIWDAKKINRNTLKYQDIVKYLALLDNLFTTLSKDLSTPIEYYEDVFTKKKFKYSQLGFEPRYVDTRNKLRREINLV